MTNQKPTPAQAAVIRYYAGDRNAAANLKGRGFDNAADACKRRGWIADTEVWPYMAATTAGLTAVTGSEG